MLILGYCPKCGYVFSDKKEADVDDFSNSRCRFCGFSDGLIAEPEVHHMSFIEGIKFSRVLPVAQLMSAKLTLLNAQFQQEPSASSLIR